MHFSFHINLNDWDYLDYNTFWAIRSPYGKKQMMSLRILIAVLFACVAFLSVLWADFAPDSWISLVIYGVLLVLFEVFLNPFFSWILKNNIKAMKSSGKMGYSPVSDMEFHDEYFTEMTPENKVEQKYSVIERISVIGEKYIYIHVNNIMSYIIPSTAFESREQYNAFLIFLKTKCSVIDYYN